jgi:hypothetical protein
VPRSGYRARLKPGVGLLGAALLPGVAQSKSRPCPPSPSPASGAVHCGGRAVIRAARCPRVRWWKHARAGSKAHAGSGRRGTALRGKVAAWSRSALSYAMRGLASPARCGCVLLGPAAGRAAGSAVPQQGQARDGGHGAAGRSSSGRWCHAPSLPRPDAVSGAMVHDPPRVAASCRQGGARGGGGRRSPADPGIGIGLQHPNKGLQATANSVRSCLAPALRRA